MRYPCRKSSNCCHAVNSSTTTRKTLDADRGPQFPLALEIDLTDDRIVPDVLLDGPFERFAHVDPPCFPGHLLARTCTRDSQRPSAWRCARGHCSRFPPVTAPPVGFWSGWRDPPLGLQRAERVLHDPILERVERDHRERPPSSRRSTARFEKSVEPFKLPVHPDPEGLKRARRRIDPRVAVARNRPANDVREPACRGDRRLGARR